MVFTSPLFLYIFLPAFFGVYLLSGRKLQNLTILLASIFFYAWGEPRFSLLVVLSIIIDYLISKILNAYKEYPDKWFRMPLLWLGIGSNLSLLIYFKYANLLMDTINSGLCKMGIASLPWIAIALPIGVSFIVFEKITYLVDTYRGISPPSDSILKYATYILLFPKLMAGPIVKYHDISDQLNHRTYSLENICQGTCRFIIGLSKKVFIADVLGVVADAVFKMPDTARGTWYAWIGILCFTFQIYFDFSGYSDMAIGLSRVLGFRLMENFRNPYISGSFTEFWQRWHISLSAWIKEYLYFPLGGNRCAKTKRYLNLWVCFMISGLWHGANWTFVAWGAYHGLFLVIDKIFWSERAKKLPSIVSVPITFLMIMIGWVFFRATSIHEALLYLKSMFVYAPSCDLQIEYLLQVKNSTYVSLILAFALSFWTLVAAYVNRCFKCNIDFSHFNWLYSNLIFNIVLLGICLVKVSSMQFSPFIYFRF